MAGFLRQQPLSTRSALEPASRVANLTPDLYRSPRPRFLTGYRVPLFVLALGAVLIAVTWLAWTPVLDAVAEGAAAIVDADDRARWSMSVAVGAMMGLAWIATWARATHPRRAVRLSDGRGTIAVDALAGRLRDAILDVEDVREADVRVENRGRRGVTVRVWLQVSPRARIDDLLEGVDRVAEWAVRERLGVALAEWPLVDVRYDELDLRPRPVHLPDGEPAAQDSPTDATQEDA